MPGFLIGSVLLESAGCASEAPEAPIGRLSWTWSAGNGRWIGAERGLSALEADGAPVQAVNVVVLRVDVGRRRSPTP